MCGGGGGDSGAAARQAEEAAAAKRRAAIGSINATFDHPGQRRRYDQIGNEVYNLNKVKVDENHEEAARQRKFQLARTGGLGGSQDAYTSGQLSDNYLEALVDAERFADSRKADLRATDERSRANLINQANAGLDPGVSSQLSWNAVNSNLSTARSQDNYANIGDLMSNLALGQQAQQIAAGQSRARKTYEDNPYAWSASNTGTGGSTTAIG